jgi:asparagine synthase (glutamine-hydrolysing)
MVRLAACRSINKGYARKLERDFVSLNRIGIWCKKSQASDDRDSIGCAFRIQDHSLMCGIAGAFGFLPEADPVDLATVERINEAQRRRGPDGEGLWQSPNLRVVLAHRRLAIIDTGPTGAQPMVDATGRWTITFNGEIYNYRELRAELEHAGVKFFTKSDTEVLINAVAVWGEAGLSKVRGMFAFALWDAQKHELWLVRDPYGIKPLYIAESRGVLWFASQARALARHAPIDISRDSAGLVGFYYWGHIPEPFTWWSGISALPAGHVRRVRAGEVPAASRAFWSIENSYLPKETNPISANEVRVALLDSVRHHLVADVPVGIFLSSGVDSSVIAALASEEKIDLQTITLAFDDYAGSSDDEATLAETTASLLGTRHSTVRIGRDHFISLYDDFFASMDQPSIDGLNVFLISHAAATLGLKVVLSGLGGDELFGGYPSFKQIPRLLTAGRAIPFSSTGIGIIENCIRNVLPHNLSPKIASTLSQSQDLPSAYLLRRSLHTSHEFELLLDESWIKSGIERLQTKRALQKTVDLMSDCGIYAQVAALESCWYLRNQLLRDADWASMAYSLELRVPLVDAQLLERLGPAIASSKPPSKADFFASAYRLPPELERRPKTGFSTPVRDWIGSEIGSSTRGLRGWASEVHRHFKSNIGTFGP